MSMDTGLTISIHEVPSSKIFPDHQSAIKRLSEEKPILEFRFDDEKTRLLGTGNTFPKAVMFRQIDVDLGDDHHPPLVVNHALRDGPWWDVAPTPDFYPVGASAYLYHPCRYIEFMQSSRVAGGIWDDMDAVKVLRSIEAFALLALGTPDEKVMKELDKPRTSLLRVPKGWSPLSAAYKSKKFDYLNADDFSHSRFRTLELMDLKVDGVKMKSGKKPHGSKKQFGSAPPLQTYRSLISTMRSLQKRVKSGKTTIMTTFLLDPNYDSFPFEGVPIEERPFIDGRYKRI